MMQGQWFGTFEGTNRGRLIVNLDRRPDGYGGSASVVDLDPGLPAAVYFVTILSSGSPGRVTGHMDLALYFDPATNRAIPRDDVKQRFPQLENEATRAQIEGNVTEATLTIGFRTNADTHGTATLNRQGHKKDEQGNHITAVPRKKLSWEDFKKNVARPCSNPPIYRGQSAPHPIRTSFHRADRFDLVRFGSEDVPRLQRAITAVTDTTFSMADPLQHAAVVGIAQHHGFPTPLLDWTKSPYVAAYFASKELKGSPTIFSFDAALWRRRNGDALTAIDAALPALVLVEPIPLLNPRLIPQQSVLMYCNVDNLEHFVAHMEGQSKESYLTAYEITTNPRATLRDLRMMGVYAGSLFPGLDGMCRGAFEDTIETDD